MTSAAEAKQKTEFDVRVQRYLALGFSNERTVQQLMRTGYPVELIKARFPNVPATLFERPQLPERRLPASIETARSRVEEGGPVKTLPMAAAHPSSLVQTSGQPAVRKDGQPTATPRSPPVAQALQRLKEQSANEIVHSEGISFHYVPLIQCSFPHADPGDVSVFSRKNGWLELTLSATRPGTGLPYGVPARLLTIYCASEAIRTQSPEIYLGTSITDFLRRLDIPVTRGERGSLHTYTLQLLRLIHCALSIDENMRDANGRAGLHLRQALFAEEAQLWWDNDRTVGQGSSLVLSSVLFHSIIERSAPLSTAAIKHLRKSPMDLDVYAWLVHRLFHLKRQSTISWDQLSGQFGHDYAERRYFRRSFLDSLKRVHGVYQEAKFKIGPAGMTLLPSRPHVARS